MVEQRLESVVTRLEALASKVCGEPAGAAKAAPMKAAAGGAPAGKDLSGTFATATSSLYAELEKTAQPHADCVKIVTTMFIAACKNQEAVLATMCRFSKPADLAPFMQSTDPADAAFKKGGRKAPANHMKALIDAFQLFNWIQYDAVSELTESYPTFAQAVQFYGNKVLTAEKENDRPFIEALYKVATAVEGFVMSNAATVSKWTGKQDGAGAAAFYAAACAGGVPA